MKKRKIAVHHQRPGVGNEGPGSLTGAPPTVEVEPLISRLLRQWGPLRVRSDDREGARC